jgi:hypothetical protein
MAGNWGRGQCSEPRGSIVAFHLGMCRVRPSYNAVTWYFPKYGETFNPGSYINACTGKYVGFSLKEVSCPDVRIANSSDVAKRVQVIRMSCASASHLIALSPATRYMKTGGRFIQSGYRCGTTGRVGLGAAFFDCQLGQREFLYQVTTR